MKHTTRRVALCITPGCILQPGAEDSPPTRAAVRRPLAVARGRIQRRKPPASCAEHKFCRKKAILFSDRTPERRATVSGGWLLPRVKFPPGALPVVMHRLTLRVFFYALFLSPHNGNRVSGKSLYPQTGTCFFLRLCYIFHITIYRTIHFDSRRKKYDSCTGSRSFRHSAEK